MTAVTPPPGTVMRVGVNVAPADYSARWPRYPGATLCRAYGPPGGGIPPWVARTGRRPTLLATLPAHVTPHVSFKDWPGDDLVDAAVTGHLNGLPADRTEWLTYHHEPETDGAPDAAEYRRRWGFLADVVHAHPARPRVTLVPIQTLQWVDAPTKGGGDWSLWWAGVGDLMGWDCYADSWRGRYPAVGQWLATPIRAAARVGLPLAVPELGAIRKPWDTGGVARAAWIRTVAAALRAGGCAAVSWWDATGTGGRDFRLDDRASRAAWDDVLTARA